MKFLKKIQQSGSGVTVVFGGYASSPKDHDHKRRSKYYCPDIKILMDISCTTPKKKLLSNPQNTTQLIELLAGIFRSNAINVVIAKDDTDTLIVSTALRISFQEDVEIKGEDTDVLCLLTHHYVKATYAIVDIYNKLKPEERTNLLFSHSFLGCDTVTQ